MRRGQRSVGLGWSLDTTKSAKLFEQAQAVIPGGVQGDARRCDPYPLYMTHAQGATIADADGNHYRDFHANFGAVLLGHNHPAVRAALQTALDTNAVTFGTCHPWEIELAELVRETVPGSEKTVFPTTGSEAVAFAFRLARAVTGRDLILKFEGNYNGSSDIAFSSAYLPPGTGGPRENPDTVPGSAGMTPGAAKSLIVREYNDIGGVISAFDQHADQLAAVVMEPVFYNGGVIEPAPGFLSECRRLCDQSGALLIFDQLITGWRESVGGAAVTENVVPDLSTFGKALSNGMPIAAISGRAEYMDQLSPRGPAYFSGTHAGHALSVRAALACIRTLLETPPYEHLQALGQLLTNEINVAIADLGVSAQIKCRNSVFALYFTDRPIRNYRDLATATSGKAADLQTEYLRLLNQHGLYLHPWWILRGFLTAAHTESDVGRLIDATVEFLTTHRRELMPDAK